MSVPKVGGIGGSGLALALTALADGGLDPDSNNWLNAEVNVVTTVATIGDSVSLPPVTREGAVISVKNEAANALDIQPASGDSIDGAAADAELVVAGGACAILIATQRSVNADTNKAQEGQWTVLLNA